MQATTKKTRGHELRAIVKTIRAGWSEEERESRRRIGEVRQKWLLGMLQDAAETGRGAS